MIAEQTRTERANSKTIERWSTYYLEDFLNDSRWEYVVEHLKDERSGMRIADRTGFLKKGG
jgi:hypothetical protein